MMNWRACIVSALATLAAFDASAECRRAPEAALPFDDAVAGSTQEDGRGRLVAPVFVNGEGPFRFIIDTGANRSALSTRLVERLGLTPSGMGEVHSVYGAAPAPLVDVQTLRYGDLVLSAGELPVIDGPVLAREDGLLGVDGMEGRRLTLDFENGCIEIEASRRSPPRGRRWAELRGELRFGHLVVVRGEIDRVPVNVLIDTGSDTSLANAALRDALNARRDRSRRATAATANSPVVLENTILLRRLSLGQMDANNVPVFVGDFYIFALWEMLDEPTMLLGMDVLSKARAMSIDYARAVVYFRL